MPATVETKIWQALKARVATLPGGYAINWPLAPFTPPKAGNRPLPYVECRHIPNRNNRFLMGSTDPQERRGILQMTLCWPATNVGTGSGKTHPDDLIQRAGEIAAHFPTDLAMDFEGIRVRVERAADVAQAYRDEAYARCPVSIRWQAFA